MPEFIQLKEGNTQLKVPPLHSSGGPGKIYGTVFFNEQMAFNRDVSVMALKSLGSLKVADCMTATGARAVRIANEAPKTEVVANDISRFALPYIEENISLNKLTNCRASIKSLHTLLAEEVFDYIDLDPFGSPVPFIHSAIQGCKRKGILAITATDTAPLSGAHRAKCERRYQSRPLRGIMCHEVGLRILMAHIVKELAKFDKGITPLLSFFTDHYFRTYIRVNDGSKNADDCLSQLKYLSYNQNTMERSISDEKDDTHIYGRIWSGNLHNKDFLSSLSPEGMSQERKCTKMIDLWSHELDHIPFLYDLSELSSHLKTPTPPFDVLLDIMNSYGKTTKTHMSPTSFKTVLSYEEVESAFMEASSR